ncbi:hypothetical protein [Cribrihabitans pelagius]|uniref:hypothetical protein n=1 Tax=Cribrihabitans pelagius TaxID=1765746 RepID=UPI003B5CB7BC
MPGPQSGKGTGVWNPSTISGNIKRGTGILNNELYIGCLVRNRLTYDTQPGHRETAVALQPARSLEDRGGPAAAHH